MQAALHAIGFSAAALVLAMAASSSAFALYCQPHSPTACAIIFARYVAFRFFDDISADAFAFTFQQLRFRFRHMAAYFR